MLDQTKIYNNQFIVRKRISAGSFGIVYSGYDLQAREHIAIKVEQDNEIRSLEREEEILRRLQGVPQIPKLLWVGRDQGCRVMVQQLLGRDLQHYVRQKQQFTLQCIVMIAEQMLTILENVHNKGIIHRDIKPENIVYDNNSKLYLIDYGISKIYRNGDEKHIPFKEGKPFIGTSRYASVSAHKGFEVSRKDDLESLAYVLIYLFKGSLPWQSLQSGNEEEKLQKVLKMKMKLKPAELCKDMPVEFTRYLDLVKSLKFKDRPDYKYFQFLFNKMRETYRLQHSFDWSNERTQKRSSTVLPQQLQITKPPETNEQKQDNQIKTIFIPSQSGIQIRRITQVSRETENKINRPILRPRSTTASCNSSNYSDVKPEPSVMIGLPMMTKFSTLIQESPKQNAISSKLISQGNQFLVHKFSLEMMNNYKNASLLELQLEMNHKEGVAEQQLNEDESPYLDQKLDFLSNNSVEISLKNHLMTFKHKQSTSNL